MRLAMLLALSLVVGWMLALTILTPALAAQPLMKIRLHLPGGIATATLDDTAAAREFAALLPLSLTLKDYAVVERIADLPRRLSVRGAPAGHTPVAGDVTYYAPWGNLAFFVGGDAPAAGLVRLGRVDSGLAALQAPGPLPVRIERIDD